MEIKPFTEEELEILRKNPAVESVTPYFLHLTSEFKSWFYIEYQSGKTAPQILRDAGFDLTILRQSRVRSIRYHILADRKKAEQGKGTIIRAKPTEIPERVYQLAAAHEKIARLEKQLKHTTQELEFVKKIINSGFQESQK